MFSPPFVGVNGVNMTFLLPIHIYNIYLKSMLNTSKVGYSQWAHGTHSATTSTEHMNFPIEAFPYHAFISTPHLGYATPTTITVSPNPSLYRFEFTVKNGSTTAAPAMALALMVICFV